MDMDEKYNTFVTGNASGDLDHTRKNLNTLWGCGDYVDKGYGEQGTVLPARSPNEVTLVDWKNFLDRIETIAAHQGSQVANYARLDVNDIETALSTIETDLTTLTKNRHNAVASGPTVTLNGTSQRNTPWSRSISTIQRFECSTVNALRYFFNSGGLLKMSFLYTGKNKTWADLCEQMGTIYLSGSTHHVVNDQLLTGVTQVGGGPGGAGSVRYTLDVFNLTKTNQTLIIKYADTAPYTLSYIKIQARVFGLFGYLQNMYGARQLEITTTFVDDSDDVISGTISTMLSFVYPNSTYLPGKNWRTPELSIVTEL